MLSYTVYTALQYDILLILSICGKRHRVFSDSIESQFSRCFLHKKLLKKVTFLNSGENTKSTEELNNIFAENRLLNLVCPTNCLTVKGFALVF